MTHEYKGKEYEVQQGKRGGNFFIDDSGKKHYLKNENPKPKEEKPQPLPEKKRYVAWIDVYNKEGERVDDFKEWVDAYSKQEAMNYFRDDHRDEQKYHIEIYKIENINED